MKTILFTLLLISQLSFGQCWEKIASKNEQVIAISLDSSLWRWGGYANRALSTPTVFDSANNWVEIATGNQFNAAIKEDGTLWMWGENSFGQLGDGSNTNKWVLTQVGQDSNWKQVSCGDQYTYAIKNNGTLWAWGRNNYGQLVTGLDRTNSNIPMQIGVDSNWIEISASRYGGLGKQSDNTLWYFGNAINSSINSQVKQVGTSNNWKTMSSGNSTEYGIQLNGTLWEWNYSNGNLIGLAQVGTDTDWLKVDNSHTYSTSAHTLFLKTNGTIWSVGRNNFGQLGDGTIVLQNTPVQVGVDTDWKDVVAGYGTSFGLKTDNSLYAWGRNNHAQFGNGKNESKLQPIVNHSNWKLAITSSGYQNGHTLAIKDNGTLWGWGQNNDSQLGNGLSYVHSLLPIQVGNDSIWSNVTGGFHFSIGVKTNGTLWGWGRNGRSQLGIPGSFGHDFPTQIGVDSNWLMVAAGSEFVLGLKSNGTLWAWGYNYDGQIGNGTTTTATAPTQIGTDSNWTFITAGDHHSMALKSDSTLWTWGDDGDGQLGRSGNRYLPTQVGTDKWITIGAGGFHSLGVKSDSTLWAWGENLYAQVGNGGTSDVQTPTQISTDNNWRSVEGGRVHSVASKVDGSIWAWGRNGNGQTADSLTYLDFIPKTYTPTKIGHENKWEAVSGGALNSLFIDTNGLMYTCGEGFSFEYQSNFPQQGYVNAIPQQIASCNLCNASYTYIYDTICSGDSLFFNSTYLSTSGTYWDTLVGSSCDSIISLDLVVNTPSVISISQAGSDLVASTGFVSYQWYLNGAIISGAIYMNYTPSQNGNYIVVGVDTNGCEAEDIFTLNTVEIDNVTTTDINVYPNPTNNIVTIDFNDVNSRKISIIDCYGKLVYEKVSNRNVEILDIRDLSSGVYILHVVSSEGEIKKQILKN